MRFRPCIDIHNGKVKQIVGGSLKDEGSFAADNFVSEKGADYYALMYKESGLTGGHVILLNKSGTPEYEADLAEAGKALNVYRGGLQIGGGVTEKNAKSFIDMGASHVIITSFAFAGGKVIYENLEKLALAVGKERIVLDLSCRKKDGKFLVVTDRWQKFTDEEVSEKLLEKLSLYCDEFLVHAVDVEGRQSGIETKVVNILAGSPIPVTYAGGVSSLNDIHLINDAGKGKVDVTVGSALDIFGGKLSYGELCDLCRNL